MTQDEIIRMAREAGIGALTDYGKEAIERFAALVAAHERDVLLKQLQQQHDDGLIDAWDVLELLKVEK